MTMWAGIGKGVSTIIIAGGAVVLLGVTIRGWAGMEKEPMTVLISNEKKVLEEVHGACFPVLGIGRNESTCKLWLREYRNMKEFAYSDSDLFAADIQKETDEAYKRLYERKETVPPPPITADNGNKQGNE